MTNTKPTDGAADQNEYAKALEEVRQRTRVTLTTDIESNAAPRMEQAAAFERLEVEAKFPTTTKHLSELTSEQPAPSISAFAGFCIFMVAFTLWCWRRLRNSKGRAPKLKNASSGVFGAIDTRATVVIAVLWLICTLLWGYIWRWESSFTDSQFSALLLAGPLITFLGWAGLRWIRAAKE
jgi:hypothetical protein